MGDNDGFIATLVSPQIRRILATDPQVALSAAPSSTEFFAAVLIIDISGFTPMTEKFERMGPDGVEQLTAALSRYFGIIISAVGEHGGEIASLAGDALLSYWPATDEDDRTAALARALRGAATIRERLVGAVLEDDTQLEFHSALAAGSVRRLFVGGHGDHRLSVVTGAPLDALGDALGEAASGDLILTKEAAARLRGAVSGEPVSGGMLRFAGFAADTGAAPPDSAPDARARVDEALLLRFLQEGLRRRIAAGHTEWLAEIRPLSIAFLSAPGFDPDEDGYADRLHRFTLQVQEVVHAYGGVIQEMVHDDKGMIFFIVFGLPMMAHEDDALRAVLAAASVRGALAGRGFSTSIGVATGMSYSGLLGTAFWRSHSIRGTVVNRAARLMGAADGEILVDAATWRQTRERIDYDDARAITLKGLNEPISVYCVGAHATGAPLAQKQADFVGRSEETARVAAALRRFETEGGTQAIIVEGEPGVGKTSLIDWIERLCDPLTTFRTNIDPLELGAVYGGWRGVFQRLAASSAHGSNDQRLDGLARILPDDEAARQRAPLLGPVLRLAIPDTALTAQMAGVVRAENTDDLMISVLEGQAMGAGPIVVIIDDCQWMDTASWRLLRKLSERDAPILFVLGARTDREAASEPLGALLERNSTEHVLLSEMDRPMVGRMIAGVLGVRTLPDELAEMIYTRSGGNPYYAFELAQALREQGLIQIADGECVISGASDILARNLFPDTVERVIVSRVDRLEPDVQLTLKVASVIGRQYLFSTLVGVHPLRPDWVECQRFADALSARGLTSMAPHDDLTYVFRHLITHQTVYELLAFAYRRELHLVVANWIERNVPDAAVTQAVVLANHFLAAEEYERAFDYLETAARAALDTSSYGEAADLFDRALDAMEKSARKPDPVRRAKVHFGLGEIHMRTGRVEASYEAFVRGLDILGLRWPREKSKVGLAILKSLAAQAGNRIRGRRPDASRPTDQRALALADGLEQFSYLFFFAQRFDEMFLANVLSLNFTERANTAPGAKKRLVQMAANMAIGGSVGVADYYLRKAAEIPAEGSTDVDLAFGDLFLGLSYCGQARYGECEAQLLMGVERARKVGNKRLELDLSSFYARSRFELGQHDLARRLNDEYLATAMASEDQAQHQCFAIYSVGQCRLREGDLDGAKRDLLTARDRLMPNYDLDRLLVLGTLSHLEFRLGDHAQALALASEALEIAERAPPTGFYLTDAYAGVASVFLDFLEQPGLPAAPSPDESKNRARRALKIFRGVAKKFASNRPRYLILQGRLHALAGEARKAEASIRDGIALADGLGIAFDHAQGLLAMGALTHLDDAARAGRLAEAEAAFSAIGLPHWAGVAAEARARLAA